MKILALSLDKSGKAYVAITEGVVYPIYTVMFHPEKPAYEWNPGDHFPHDVLSIEVG